MELDEVIITRAIVEQFFRKLSDNIESDIAIVGGGPSGLIAGYFLSKAGRKVAMFERKLSVGGGMWGGGMLFNEIVVQESALPIMHEFGISCREFQKNYYTADSVEAVSTLISKAVQAGLTIFNGVMAEDVLMRKSRVTGLVLNWSAVEIARLHVDPLTVRARYVIDATGHETAVVRLVQNKVPGKLKTQSGKVEGEKSMWSEKAETLTLINTKEVFPGLYVAGMAANATFGGPRMGPIFGGMLLSGKKVANTLLRALSSEPRTKAVTKKKSRHDMRDN
jgi:thiazole biosynthesis enzyme